MKKNCIVPPLLKFFENIGSREFVQRSFVKVSNKGAKSAIKIIISNSFGNNLWYGTFAQMTNKKKVFFSSVS